MTNQEIIVPGEDSIPKKTPSLAIKNFNELKQELSSALVEKGMDMTFIAGKLNMIIEKAYLINNKGDEAPDFKTMLEATKVLLKIYGFDLSDKKTQIAIFNNVPAKGEKLNF